MLPCGSRTPCGRFPSQPTSNQTQPRHSPRPLRPKVTARDLMMVLCMYGPRGRALLYAKYVIRYHAIMSGHVRGPKHAMRFLDHTFALLCLGIHNAIDDSDGCRPLLSNTCPSRRHAMFTHRSVITIVLFGLHIRTSLIGAALDHHPIFFSTPRSPVPKLGFELP